MVICVCKFLTELVFNRANRLRFDTSTIDGLIVLKETAKYVIQLLTLWGNFQNKPSNGYKEKWCHLKIISHLFTNMLTGNYVNFAICDYYSDSIFTNLARSILQSIASSDLNELRQYPKVDKKVHSMLF